VEETIIFFGGNVKALGDGKIGGQLVLYSGPDDPDISPMRDYFTKETDFGPHITTPVFYDHGMDQHLKGRILDRKAKLNFDDPEFVWIEAQLALRDAYEKDIYEMVEAGKLGWSSGTAPHLVEREQVKNAHWVRTWFLGLDASLTPTPAEPRTRVISLKSYRALKQQRADSSLKNLFETELATQKTQAWELWNTLSRVFEKIAKAAQVSNVTGSPVDVAGLVSEAVTSFSPRLSAAVISQITDFAKSDDEYFYLKSAADFLKSSLVSGLPLQSHSDTVVSAVEEFATSTAALAQSLKGYAQRVKDKQKFREETKAGRMISQANRDRMSAACERIKTAMGAMDDVHADLSDLITMATPDEPKAITGAEVRNEFARFLEFESRLIAA
jgi:hypothetical protein